MKKIYNGKYLMIAITLILSSCAKSYLPIRLSDVPYREKVTNKDVSFEYSFNILRESGNDVYARKAVNKKIDLIAVKVVNNGEDTLFFNKDVTVYDDDVRVVPMSPLEVQEAIKQPAGLYALYFLVWGVYQQCENDDCTTIPIPVGAPFGIANIATASTANKRLLNTLQERSLLGKVIAPGDTIYGLLAIKESKNRRLRFELKQ